MQKKNENGIIREKVSSSFERRITYLDNLMVVVCDFTNGPMTSPEPPHSHPHEQITFIAEGELLFFKDGEKYQLSEGDLITIPGNVPHSIQTISGHVKLIDSFTPVRKDFLKAVQTNTYEKL